MLNNRNQKLHVLKDNSSYVAGKLCGGLGNQLFIIAATYAYSLKNKKQFYLSKSWDDISSSRPAYWDTLLKNLTSYTTDFKKIKICKIYKEPKFSFDQIPDLEDNLILNGYFQSSKYFEEYAPQIRELLSLPEDLEKFSTEKMKLYEGKTTVAVHIRHGDYLKHSDVHYIQDINYYIKSKYDIEKKLGFTPTYLYFSDDTQWVKDKFEMKEQDSIISCEKDYQEFVVMTKCNHFIIANSSFSWWAAWLSQTDKDKIVIAPSKWFASKGPQDWQDIYPPEWLQNNDYSGGLFCSKYNINLSNQNWRDDILVEKNMNFQRHSHSSESGVIFVNDNDVTCIWNNYAPESTINQSLTLENTKPIKLVEKHQSTLIKNKITPLTFKEGNTDLYLINLEQRNDQKEQFLKNIEPYPFNVKHFKAVKHTRGFIGCGLSHLYLVKYAKENNLPFIVVAEDDSLIKVKPEEVRELLSLLSGNLDKWQVFNGSSYFIDNSHLEIKLNQSTSFMIYNSSIYDMILKYDFTQDILQFISWSFSYTLYNHNPFSICINDASEDKKLIPLYEWNETTKSQSWEHKLRSATLKEVLFMGIISCKKYEDRRKIQNMNGCMFPYKYFVGNPELKDAEEKDGIVYLPCKDNYESLPEKVHQMLKWVNENRPHFKYIIKADDDVRFNFSLFKDFASYIFNSKYDYAGIKTKINQTFSDCHIGKSEDGKLNKTKMFIPTTVYCAGPCYFLSKKSVDILLKNMLKENTIYEDQSVGYCLHKNNIDPVHVKLQNTACFWV